MKFKLSKHPATPALIALLFLSLSAVPTTLKAQTSESQPAPAAPEPQPPPPPSSTSSQTDRDKAAEQLKRQEKQRILGVIPQFNVSNISNAVRLNPHQKIQLAFKTSIDPFTFLFAGIDSAISQADDSFPGYGLGAKGYAKRFGASYADSFDGNMIGNAFLPILLHQDPRYFRKGSGRIAGRFAYAMLSTVRCKSDRGHWQPNYSNVLGNFAAGGVSNLYYPSSERGLVQTYQRAIVVSAEGAIGATLAEFWPDISRHFFGKHNQRPN